MYLPAQFQSADVGHTWDLIRGYPFAALVSVDDDGLPFVTHLPLHLQDEAGAATLLGHVARPNPHWRYLAARPRALVVFTGPHAYLSPRVYPDLARVPSWNYLAVHCTVEAELVDGPQEKDELLKTLIADHEPGYAAQWQAMDRDLAGKMLAGIVGFALRITDVQCKLKLNQHRPQSHAAMAAMYASGNENERALVEWMRRLGMSASAEPAAQG